LHTNTHTWFKWDVNKYFQPVLIYNRERNNNTKIPSESTVFNNDMIADLLEIKNTMQLHNKKTVLCAQSYLFN
jgi:hypothetical protein